MHRAALLLEVEPWKNSVEVIGRNNRILSHSPSVGRSLLVLEVHLNYLNIDMAASKVRTKSGRSC